MLGALNAVILAPLGAAAWVDFRNHQIPLWTSLTVLGLAILKYALRLHPIASLLGGVLLGAAIFAAAILLPGNPMGGGDVKLLAALSVYYGFAGGLVLMAASAVITLALWLFRRDKRMPLAPGIFLSVCILFAISLF